jgi:hypothetical protein
MTYLGAFVIHDANVWRQMVEFVRPRAKQAIADGKPLQVVVSEATRTNGQNAKFHAICSDLASAGVQWAGKPRAADHWKVLLVSGHAMATKEEVEVVQGLEGELVNVRESTASMSRRRGASLIEYAQAFCAANGLHTN